MPGLPRPEAVELQAVEARAIWMVQDGRRHLLAVYDQGGLPTLVAELPVLERRALAIALLRSLLPTFRRSS